MLLPVPVTAKIDLLAAKAAAVVIEADAAEAVVVDAAVEAVAVDAAVEAAVVADAAVAVAVAVVATDANTSQDKNAAKTDVYLNKTLLRSLY